MDMKAPGCGDDVAPYLLGALTPDESARFERHLEGCELCRADVERLRPALDALPASPEPVTPPADLRRRVMADVKRDAKARRAAASPAAARRPAWLRPLPALAAACVLLVVGVVGGIGLSGGGERTVDGQVAIAGADASLSIEDGDGELRVAGLPATPDDRTMQVWLVRDGGAPQPDALFVPDADGRASVPVDGDLDGVDRVLVSQEPRGGSRAPTTQPFIDIEVS
jgi:anti-sigma-K factor RskA